MGYLFVILSAVLWGLIGPVSRVALADGVEPLEIAFWRAAVGGACFAAHAAAIRKTRLERRDVGVVAAFGVVGIALFWAAFLYAIQAGGAALAAVLLYTAPAWVALLSAALLGERMTGRKALSVALAVGGVAGIALAGGGGSVRPSLAALGWGLLASGTYALHYLFGKTYFPRYATPTLLLYALPVAAVALLPFVPFRPKTAEAWGAILFLALVPTYLSFLLYSAGLRRVEATRAATVATIEPVVAAIAAYVAWGERMSLAGYLFAALVVAAVVLMVTGEKRGRG